MLYDLFALHVCSVVSDSLQPHGLLPPRLLCPQDSPGKNTGVVALSSSRGSSQPRDLPATPGSPTLPVRFFTNEPSGSLGSPQNSFRYILTGKRNWWRCYIWTRLYERCVALVLFQNRFIFYKMCFNRFDVSNYLGICIVVLLIL